MLVLSRKANQSIMIGDSIEVKILAAEGNSVKIGIEAPEDIRVLRGELWEAFLEQEQIARRLASGDEPQTFSQLRELLVESQQECSLDSSAQLSRG